MANDPTLIMLDQLMRIILMEGLKALVWGATILLVITLFGSKGK